MDGLTTWGEVKEILVPLAWGGIASTALLIFIFCWNEALCWAGSVKNNLSKA